jgi:uncharacterized protein YdcH (DUF465 family)
MNEPSPDVKAWLMQTDDEFHRLADQHHALEDRLHELTEKHYLSDTELVEEANIKKRKLLLKDRMQSLMRHREHAHH